MCLLLIRAVSAHAAAPPTERTSVVIFQFAFVGSPESGGVTSAVEKSADEVGQHADDLCVLIGDGLTTNRFLSVVKFERGLATVQRAVREQRLTEKDADARLDTTPAGLAKARKMASLTGSQVAVLGSIDKYDYRQYKGEVEITATVQLVNVATGKIINTFTATGRAAGAADKPADEIAVGSGAVYDVAEKLIADIVKVNPIEQISPEDLASYGYGQVIEEAPRHKNRGIITAMLGAVVLGFLIGSR